MGRGAARRTHRAGKPRAAACALRLARGLAIAAGVPAGAAEDLARVPTVLRRDEVTEYTRTHFVAYGDSVDIGFNNRLQGLQIALVAAIVTRRTLVVNPFGRERTLRFEQDSALPYTTYFEAIRGWPVVLSSDPRFRRVAPQGHEALEYEPGSMVRNDVCSVSLQSVAARHRGARPRVLKYVDSQGYWEAMFQPEDHAFIRAVLGQHLRFHQGIEAGAALLRRWLPAQYGAIHFRLWDCPGQALLNCSAVGLAPGTVQQDRQHAPVWSGDPKMAIEWGCVCVGRGGRLRVGDTELGLARADTVTGLGGVYVATNAPTDRRVPRLLEQIRARGARGLLWEDLPAALRARALELAQSRLETDAPALRPEPLAQARAEEDDPAARREPPRDGAMISVLEQLLCVAADSFLPSWPSSWDATVIELRLASGRSDAPAHSQLMIEAASRHSVLFGSASSPEASCSRWWSRHPGLHAGSRGAGCVATDASDTGGSGAYAASAAPPWRLWPGGSRFRPVAVSLLALLVLALLTCSAWAASRPAMRYKYLVGEYFHPLPHT